MSKRHFFVFCAILCGFVGLLALGGWSTYVDIAAQSQSGSSIAGGSIADGEH